MHQGAFNALKASRQRCRFPKKSKQHRRGKFAALNCGISHGGGQTVRRRPLIIFPLLTWLWAQKPGNLYHSAINSRQLNKLLANSCIKRIAGHSSAAFAAWAPKLYTYYENHLDQLLDSDPVLQRNFPNSVWSAAAFNFGPRTITRRHRDYANLPFGWCGVTALGDFDPKQGGHLVLWSMKLVIEFPPGSTILLPSAVIPHSNTPISHREQRASLTQFTAGGLFRWVDQGFQLKATYMAGLTEEQEEEDSRAMEERCKLGLKLFSTAESLPADLSAFNGRI